MPECRGQRKRLNGRGEMSIVLSCFLNIAIKESSIVLVDSSHEMGVRATFLEAEGSRVDVMNPGNELYRTPLHTINNWVLKVVLLICPNLSLTNCCFIPFSFRLFHLLPLFLLCSSSGFRCIFSFSFFLPFLLLVFKVRVQSQLYSWKITRHIVLHII